MVSNALEDIDRELEAQYGKDGWQVERKDCRTLQTTYGIISIKRRRMCKDGEADISPLDKELEIRRYHRYSGGYFEYNVAQIAAKPEPLPWQLEHKKRQELVRTHYKLGLEHRKAVKTMMRYLSMYYDLSKAIVLSNSNGGLVTQHLYLKKYLGEPSENFRGAAASIKKSHVTSP